MILFVSYRRELIAAYKKLTLCLPNTLTTRDKDPLVFPRVQHVQIALWVVLLLNLVTWCAPNVMPKNVIRVYSKALC